MSWTLITPDEDSWTLVTNNTAVADMAIADVAVADVGHNFVEDIPADDSFSLVVPTVTSWTEV